MKYKAASFMVKLTCGLMIFVLLLNTLPVAPVHAAGPCLVKQDSSGANNGTNWTDAYTDLQSALQNAACSEIWVAAGTYTPTSGTDRTATFQLKNDVAIYGGFDGTEELLSQWNFRRNVTILSGEIGAPGAADNSYHVVTGSGTNSTAALAGFTITAGNAADALANNGGGGLFIDAGSPFLQYLTFSANAGVLGGGMLNQSGSSPILQESTFSGNQASFGGGIYNLNGSNPTIRNVTLDGNTADQNAGGMLNVTSSPSLLNVTFNNNSAPSAGGMENDANSSPVLKNVTFVANSAVSGYGGGLLNSASSPEIRNTLFWGNTAEADGAQIYNLGGAAPTVSDSIVQGGYPDGTNIIVMDPYLGALGNYGGFVQTIPLLPGSSAIDGGNPAYCAFIADARGRIYHGPCDIGAYDSSGFSLAVLDGDYQSTPLYRAFTHRLALTVIPNISFEPVSGGRVNFDVPASDASAVIIDNPTLIDNQGSASVEARANDTTGSYTVFAQASGAGAVSFHLTNDPAVSILFHVQPQPAADADCLAWESACSLQTALSMALAGEEIWVKEGTYTPGSLTTDTFQLNGGVGVYGGFAGDETERAQRDPAAHLTVLSGDVDHDDSQQPVITDLASVTGNANNSASVIQCAGSTDEHPDPFACDDRTTLDGFTVTAGYNQENPGGGMIISDAGPSVSHVIFSGNVSAAGGGMFAGASSPTLSDVAFLGNSAEVGGGLAAIGGDPTLTNVTFSGNQATASSEELPIGGGGMLCFLCNSTLANITFSGNQTAGVGGGGMTILLGNLSLTNVTFNGNWISSDTPVGMGGGGIFNLQGNITLNNVTFSGNQAAGAGTQGGAIANFVKGVLTIQNTIFWGNSAMSGGDQVFNDADSSASVDDSLIQGGCPDGSICSTAPITDDPRLGHLGNYGGFTQTVPLLYGSPAIDAGNDTTCAATDQRGKGRLGACDLGAFEWQGNSLSISEGNNQFAAVNTAFAHPLTVTVTPNDPGLPVDGVVVTFTGPDNCACVSLNGSPVTVGTDGFASVLASANDTPGKLTVTAAAQGADDVTFHLAILDRPSLSVTNSPVPYNGSPQAAIVQASAAGTISNVQYNGSLEVPTGPGTYAVTANFTPDNPLAFVSLASAPAGDFVITPAGPRSTTILLTSSRQPHFFGENWTLTATVAVDTGTPVGTVTFKDGDTILGTSDLVDGRARLTVSSLSVGSHTITAEYGAVVSEAIVIKAFQYLIFTLVFK